MPVRYSNPRYAPRSPGPRGGGGAVPSGYVSPAQEQMRRQQTAAGYSPRAYYNPQNTFAAILERLARALGVYNVGAARPQFLRAVDLMRGGGAAPTTTAPPTRAQPSQQVRQRRPQTEMTRPQPPQAGGYTRPPGYYPSFGAPYGITTPPSPLMYNPWYEFPGPYSQNEIDVAQQRAYWQAPGQGWWQNDPMRFTPAPPYYPPQPPQGGGGAGGGYTLPAMPRYGGGGGRAPDIPNWWRNMLYWRI